MWGSLGGEMAEKLVRSAFACIIKHSGFTEEFIDAALHVDKVVED